jgi:flagellar hook-associated protein 3 FlgL
MTDVFKNDALAPVSRLDDSTSIQSGFLASDVAGPLFEAFKQVQAYVETNGQFSSPLTEAQNTFLQGMLGSFDTARTGLTEVTARNGLNQNRLDDAMDRQSAQEDMLKGVVAGASEVDMAEAVTRLQQAQTAVQATAQVFGMLKETSLLDLLR